MTPRPRESWRSRCTPNGGRAPPRAALAELAHHDRRRRNPGRADWLIRAGGVAIAYDWPDGTDATTALVVTLWREPPEERMESRATTRATVTSRQSASGPRTDPCARRSSPGALRDYDEQTGDLVGLEVWSASKMLPEELVATLPRLEGRGTSMERQPA